MSASAASVSKIRNRRALNNIIPHHDHEHGTAIVATTSVESSTTNNKKNNNENSISEESTTSSSVVAAAKEAPSSTPMAAPEAVVAGNEGSLLIDESGNIRVVLRQRLWNEHWSMASLFQMSVTKAQKRQETDLIENLSCEQLISIDERFRL